MSAEQYWRIAETTALYAWWGAPFFVALMAFGLGFTGLLHLGAWMGKTLPNWVVGLTRTPPQRVHLAHLVAFTFSASAALGIFAVLVDDVADRVARFVVHPAIAFFGIDLDAAPAWGLSLLVGVGALAFAANLFVGAVWAYGQHWIERAERCDKQKPERA